MAQRYGRKRRAAHRAEIAQLKERLAHESTHHMYLPDENTPDLESVAVVVDYRISEEGSLYGRIERHAHITAQAPSKSLLNMFHNQRKIQFRGTQYMITAGNYGPGLESRIDLDLVGVL